jgi:disulfide bond formation protein DsbB
MAAMQRLPLASQLGLVALLGSGVMLGGALFFQYAMGFAPCEMCHWQRWPHIAAMVAGLAAFASSSRPRLATTFLVIAIAAIAITSVIGLFHAGVEYRWWQGPQSCTGSVPIGLSPEELKKYLFGAKMVRCDAVVWSLLGISMAGWNAILSAILAVGLASGLSRTARSR